MLQRKLHPAQRQKWCCKGCPNGGSGFCSRATCGSHSLYPGSSTLHWVPILRPPHLTSVPGSPEQKYPPATPSPYCSLSLPAHVQAPNYVARFYVDDGRHVACLGRERRAPEVLTPPHTKPDTRGNSSDQPKCSCSSRGMFTCNVSPGICQFEYVPFGDIPITLGLGWVWMASGTSPGRSLAAVAQHCCTQQEDGAQLRLPSLPC